MAGKVPAVDEGEICHTCLYRNRLPLIMAPLQQS